MRRTVVAAIVLTLLAIVLIPILLTQREWLRAWVVEPIVFVFWALRLMILSINQSVYWVLLVLGGALVLFFTLRYTSWGTPPLEREKSSAAPSRYAQWRVVTNNLDESKFSADLFARDLVRLSVEILSYQESLPGDEIYARIDRGDLNLDAEYTEFLRRRAFANPPRKTPLWKSLLNRVFNRKKNPQRPLTPIDLETDRMLSAIENLLEPQTTPSEQIHE